MGDDREWQKQLLSAALAAATRSAVQFISDPKSKDETVESMKSKLAEVDYSAAGRAVSDLIDRLAESSKVALSDAIDSIRANAEDAVEAAADKAQQQLGAGGKKRGKGKLFFGILMGVGLGFVLLNEDRRNRILDRMTGATGPIDSSQWSTVTSSAQDTASQAVHSAQNVGTQAQESAATVAESVKTASTQVQKSASDVADTTSQQATETIATAKDEGKQLKAGADAKAASDSKKETPPTS